MKSQPVFILLPGPSLKNIEPRIEHLKGHRPIWATVNRFPILEKKLDLRFDMVYCSSPVRMQELLPDILKLLERGDEFVTNSEMAGLYGPRFKKCREVQPLLKWNITNLGYEPGVWHNSLTAFLLWLSDNGYESIFLFGCDGGTFTDNDPIYYAEEMIDPKKENFANREKSIPEDTVKMNEQFWGLYDKYQVKHQPSIFNVTERSHVTCFQNINWEEFYATINATPKESV